MAVTREQLLEFLHKTADEGGGDQEATHSRAESMMLEYLNDPELSAAWSDAAQFWWYA